MDAISIERLQPVHPELARRVNLLDSKLITDDGIRIRVTRGMATWPEQDALYQQGRTRPGLIVTHAKPGYSAHNFGYAVDACPDDPGFPAWHPDYNARDERWKDFLALALECGLAEGAVWRSVSPDFPHLYLKELPATPDDELRHTLQDGNMQAVFALIDLRIKEYVPA